LFSGREILSWPGRSIKAYPRWRSRFTAGTGNAVLFPFAYSKLKLEWRTAVPHKAYLSITALAGITIFNTLVYVAGRYTTATNMALSEPRLPLFSCSYFQRLFFKQNWQKRSMRYTVMYNGHFDPAFEGDWDQLQRFHFTAGDLWILGAAASFAIYTLLVKKGA
jgi:drug/metabolite transporter (DMT)-like permease